MGQILDLFLVGLSAKLIIKIHRQRVILKICALKKLMNHNINKNYVINIYCIANVNLMQKIPLFLHFLPSPT